MTVTYVTTEDFNAGIYWAITAGLTFKATHADLTIRFLGGY